MLKRLHTIYVRCYEHFRMWLDRHPPEKGEGERENEHKLSQEMPWYAGDAYPCDLCMWVLMRWNKEALGWRCWWCGQRFHPRVMVTEKRPIVRPAQPQQSEEPPVMKPVFRTGQLAFLHSRHLLANSTEILPTGLPRIEWKNGVRIDTGQLKPLFAREREMLMDMVREDRKTG